MSHETKMACPASCPGRSLRRARESASDTGQRLWGETDGKRACPHFYLGYLWNANPPIYAQ